MNMNIQALHTKCFNVCAYGTFMHVPKNCIMTTKLCPQHKMLIVQNVGHHINDMMRLKAN
jgi:hypothetical protein